MGQILSDRSHTFGHLPDRTFTKFEQIPDLFSSLGPQIDGTALDEERIGPTLISRAELSALNTPIDLSPYPTSNSKRRHKPLVLILSVVICAALAMIVHELGHLVAAKRCNVSASELGLGIGPRIFSCRLGGIRFSFRAFPIASFVLLDSTALKERSVPEQLFVHLGGIIFNLIAGLTTYGTVFSWMNLLLAAGNLLPLYQHDGWKCGVVIMRSVLQRKSQPVEWAFTFSGGFASLIIAYTIIRVVI